MPEELTDHGREPPPRSAPARERADREFAVPAAGPAPDRAPAKRRDRWKSVLVATFEEMISDRIGLVAAGCAFWATLALFPAISTLITVYGLLFDPLSVEPQLRVMSQLLPPAAFTLIAQRVHELVAQSSHSLTIGLAISATVTLWSAATGTKSMLSALNLAFGTTEQRGFLMFQAVALSMTLGGIVAAVLGLAIMVGLPAAFAFIGLSAHLKGLIAAAGWILLIAFVLLALALLYRFGPSRRACRWRWITEGSLVATLMWLAASALFSVYVGRIAAYDMTYGPIATVAGVMMWFWVSTYAVLLGAELDAQLESWSARAGAADG
jgi:membrane protein